MEKKAQFGLVQDKINSIIEDVHRDVRLRRVLKIPLLSSQSFNIEYEACANCIQLPLLSLTELLQI